MMILLIRFLWLTAKSTIGRKRFSNQLFVDQCLHMRPALELACPIEPLVRGRRMIWSQVKSKRSLIVGERSEQEESRLISIDLIVAPRVEPAQKVSTDRLVASLTNSSFVTLVDVAITAQAQRIVSRLCTNAVGQRTKTKFELDLVQSIGQLFLDRLNAPDRRVQSIQLVVHRLLKTNKKLTYNLNLCANDCTRILIRFR